MTKSEIKDELTAIGSTYHGSDGWRHQDALRGKELVKSLVSLNIISAAKIDARPAAWGPRGERGTIICGRCGKRGQDRGCVCDHCGQAL